MGGQCSGENNVTEQSTRKLTVVTLSYCGLTSSPFEFYINEYEHQLERIGDYFQQYVKEELRDFTDVEKGKGMFGQIELKFKKRYSPMFDKMAGIEQVKTTDTQQKAYKFTNKQTFFKNWEQKFNEYVQSTPSFKQLVDKQDKQKLEQCKYNVKTYDFLMFKALLRYVYKEQNFNKIIEDNKNPSKYLNIISPLFEFSFLNETNKLSKFQYGFRKTNPDVYFLQETTKDLVKFLESRAKRNYRWIGDEGGQFIVVKASSFPHDEQFVSVDIETLFSLQAPKGNGAFKPIALGSKSRQFLFVSLHFSSRAEINKQQMQFLQNLLQKIQKHKKPEDPLSYENVILGGNLNKVQNKMPEGYEFYPREPTEITTFKKRTKTQGQFLKSDIRDKQSLDKIITNQVILSGEITLIDGTKPDVYADDEFKKIRALEEEKLKDLAKEQSHPSSKLSEDQLRKMRKLKEEKDKCKEGLNSKIKMLLPCEIHPFDKFLVKTIIQVPNIKNRLPANPQAP